MFARDSARLCTLETFTCLHRDVHVHSYPPPPCTHGHPCSGSVDGLQYSPSGSRSVCTHDGAVSRWQVTGHTPVSAARGCSSGPFLGSPPALVRLPVLPKEPRMYPSKLWGPRVPGKTPSRPQGHLPAGLWLPLLALWSLIPPPGSQIGAQGPDRPPSLTSPLDPLPPARIQETREAVGLSPQGPQLL